MWDGEVEPGCLESKTDPLGHLIFITPLLLPPFSHQFICPPTTSLIKGENRLDKHKALGDRSSFLIGGASWAEWTEEAETESQVGQREVASSGFQWMNDTKRTKLSSSSLQDKLQGASKRCDMLSTWLICHYYQAFCRVHQLNIWPFF